MSSRQQHEQPAPGQAAATNGPPPLALDPRDPDLARVQSAYALVSQDGMTPDLATQILSLADSTPEQIGEAVQALAFKTQQLRAEAVARLTEERAIHDDITAKLNAAAQEEAADYTALRGEQDELLVAARRLQEQVGRIAAFFGLPMPAGIAAAPARQEDDDEPGHFSRLLGLFIEERDDDRGDAKPAGPAPVQDGEPPIYYPGDDVVRKVGVLAGLIALPNKTAAQVLAMVKPQAIDLAAIGRIVGEAQTIAARQIQQSAAIVALVEARHQEEVGRLGAASNKENTQFDTVVREHAAATAQVNDLDQKIARLRQFFGFPG